jgi:hypothetical protein
MRRSQKTEFRIQNTPSSQVRGLSKERIFSSPRRKANFATERSCRGDILSDKLRRILNVVKIHASCGASIKSGTLNLDSPSSRTESIQDSSPVKSISQLCISKPKLLRHQKLSQRK